MYAHRSASSESETAPVPVPPVQQEPEPSNSELAERIPRGGGEGDGDGTISPASYLRRRGDRLRLLSFAPATTVEASPGEEIWFMGAFRDIDDREHGRTVSGDDFYEIDWEATAGSFDRAGGPSTAQTQCVDVPGDYPFSRKYLVGDVGTAPITITATIRDRGIDEEARDPDLEVTWMVVPRQNASPTAIAQQSFRRCSDTEFEGRYQVGPDGGDGRYSRQVVQESFSDPRPLQMTVEDLIPHGFGDTPEDVVAWLAGGVMGTFSCDGLDEFVDHHGGFGALDLVATFRPEAVERGISWSMIQTYRSNGQELGRFLITRTLRGETLEITKVPV